MTGPVDTSPRVHRLAAFDGLRAVAALSVLAYHVGLASAWSRVGRLAPFVGELKAGVTVFFVISGCLLYLPYVRALRAGGELPDWRRYAHRRALRIVPAYWVALTVFALSPFGLSVLTANWWRYYGLTQIYNPDTLMGGLGVAWSLCVEVSFYAVLPVFAVGAARILRTRRGAATTSVQLGVLAAVALASLFMRFLIDGSIGARVPHSGLVLATSLPGFVDWFALGMALAVLAAAWEAGERPFKAIEWLARRAGPCWILAAACFLAGAIVQQGDMFLPLFNLPGHVLAGLGAALLVLPAVAPEADRASSPVLALLRHPGAIWLGSISYGIYLWHVPLMEVLRGSMSRLPTHAAPVWSVVGLLAAVAAGAVLLGAASWYLVERPARRLFSPAPRPATAVAGA